MEGKKLKIDELRSLINNGEAQDPLIFLESVVCGQDPRNTSEIYNLVCEIEEFSDDGEISPSEWEAVVNMVRYYYKYAPVTLAESQNAAKTLAEYLHPKRKQIDLSSDSTNNNPAANPLTEEEIELFKEKFNDEF